MLLQSVYEVVRIGQPLMFYAKIINYKGEGEREGVVCPEARSGFGLSVSMGSQAFGE
jgi:hypothetical protein